MNEDVVSILKTLRDLKLDWIVDEIVESIQAGKTIFKETLEDNKNQSKKATMTVSFGDNEQIALCLNSIKSYFIDLNDVWIQAQKNLINTETINTKSLRFDSEVSFQVAEFGCSESVEPFKPSYEEEKMKLIQLLDKAFKSINLQGYNKEDI